MTEPMNEKHADEPMAAEISGESEKRGRGPTRAAVKFADLIEDIHEAGFAHDVASGAWTEVTAADARAALAVARGRRADLDEEIDRQERRAALLARVESLPPHLRAALPAALGASPPSE